MSLDVVDILLVENNRNLDFAGLWAKRSTAEVARFDL